MTPAQLQAFINQWVDNDPVKAFQKYRMNTILNALLGMYDDAVTGTLQWGNIQGDINEQTDLINYVDANIVKVRNTIADLTNVGLELVVNTGIYNNGVLVLGTTPPFTIEVTEADFSGTTCTKPEVTSIPNNKYSVFVNQWNRYLRWRQPAFDGGAYNEVELTGDGNFKVNVPGFDPSTQEFDIYVVSTI